MPELPEVENIVLALRDAQPSLIGHRIKLIKIFSDSVISGESGLIFQQKLEGCRFVSIRRQGKYLVFEVEDNTSGHQKHCFIVVHLRMTGRLWLVPAHEARAPFTRLALMLDDGLALRFDDQRKFGRVWLADNPGDVICGLGPDALTIPFEMFAERLGVYHRRLKPLLLDQSFVAGIGNIYADEILFRAGLHPMLNSGDLGPEDLYHLHGAVVSVLEEAVAAGGANIDGVFKAGSFRVRAYGREGKPCLVCGTEIVKSKLGQRGTHTCPQCQKL